MSSGISTSSPVAAATSTTNSTAAYVKVSKQEKKGMEVVVMLIRVLMK